MKWHSFSQWDTKACLWTGMIIFMGLTVLLAIFKAEKEYVMAAFALTGQLAAGLLTYVNSMKNVLGGTNETKPDVNPDPGDPAGGK